MWRLRLGSALRHKQRSDEERMLWVLDNPNLTLAIRARDTKRAALQNIHLVWIDAKVAVILLGRGQCAVNASNTGVQLEVQFHLSTCQRTSKRRNKQRRGIRVILGVLSI